MADFDLLDNDVERDLRLAVGAMLSERCDQKATADLYEGSTPTPEGLAVACSRDGAGGRAGSC
jgi:hypothetical protein